MEPSGNRLPFVVPKTLPLSTSRIRWTWQIQRCLSLGATINPGTKGPLKRCNRLGPSFLFLTINSRFFSLGDVLILRVFTIIVQREESETPRKIHQSGEKRRKINEKSTTPTTLVSSISFLKSNCVFFFPFFLVMFLLLLRLVYET